MHLFILFISLQSDLPGFCYFLPFPFGPKFHFSKESLGLVCFDGFFSDLFGVRFVWLGGGVGVSVVTMVSFSLLYNHTVFNCFI